MYQTDQKADTQKKSEEKSKNSKSVPGVDLGEMMSGPVLAHPNSTNPVQRLVREEDEGDKHPKQAKQNHSKENSAGSPGNDGNSGTSTNIPEDVLSKMENSFATSFADVKVKKDDTEASSLGAQAYTQGNNIHFAPGKFNPATHTGQELLGHELTHVVQQRDGRVSGTQNKSTSGYSHIDTSKEANINNDTSLESEADIMGKRAAQGQIANITGEGNGVQKKESTTEAQEVIFVVGGEEAQHRAWPNFINALDIRLSGFSLEPGDKLTVVVFKRFYETRGELEKGNKDFFMNQIREKIQAHEDDLGNINIEEVETEGDFFNYMNTGEDVDGQRRSEMKIRRWEYFGHGLPGSLEYGYDYNSGDNTVGTENYDDEKITTLEMLSNLDENAFANNHTFVSWGCNTATDRDGDAQKGFLEEYHNKFGGAAIGAVGKTDYAKVALGRLDIFGKRELPFPATDEAHWIAYGEGNSEGFKSYFDVGYSLRTRGFNVASGGAVRIKLSDLRYIYASGTPRETEADDKITISLRKEWQLTEEESQVFNVIDEKGEVTYNGLDAGKYYLMIYKTTQKHDYERVMGDIEVDVY